MLDVRIAGHLRVFLLLLGVTACLGVHIVKIRECQPNKYFWKDSEPTEFYACLTLKGRAVHMRCSKGTYMCGGNDDDFKPCSCSYNKVGKSDAGKFAKESSDAGRPASDVNDPYDPEDGDADDADIDLNGVLSNLETGNEPEQLTFESLPANGCPDLYRLYPSTHMYQGVSKSEHTTLISCQNACTDERNCLGVDWNKLKDTPDSERCFFIYPESTRFGLHSYHDYCCDHFRRTNCASTPVPEVTVKYDIKEKSGSEHHKHEVKEPHVQEKPVYTKVSDKKDDYPKEVHYPKEARYGVTEPVPQEPVTQYPYTSPTPPRSTTTIPDSGCPYTLEQFNSTSHPFGVNITVGDFCDEIEECKYWCLVRSFCSAVDFNHNTHTCYYVPEVNIPLTQAVVGVTHFRKVTCTPPLMCWETSTVVTTDEDLSIIDPDTPQVQCDGLCYANQRMEGVATVIERGCLPSSGRSAVPTVGCSRDNTDMSMTCFCDTARCNGLSISAQTSLLMHLPLDGGLEDHSGMDNMGQVPPGLFEPKFTCLDKVANCSALFYGQHCVSVNSLASVTLGAPKDNASVYVPQASFAVWFKRMSTSLSAQQGIFGNSPDEREPSWRIVAHEQDNYVGGGVITDNVNYQNINDYEYKLVYNDQWHLAVMTYSGVRNVTAGVFPVLNFYLDGIQQKGNAQADSGHIVNKDQPVTIGCVGGENFVGFIDEARIFNTALEPRDVEALISMRDSGHYYEGVDGRFIHKK